MKELTLQHEVRSALADARTVAILGAHIEPSKPAHYVPDYLFSQGYKVVPVNPVFAGRVLWGEPVRSTLAEIDEPIDIVDVFRLGEVVPMHVPDILAMQPLPEVVWLQLGIRNDAVAEQLIAAGIRMVQDRCTLADHRSFGLGRAGTVDP